MTHRPGPTKTRWASGRDEEPGDYGDDTLPLRVFVTRHLNAAFQYPKTYLGRYLPRDLRSMKTSAWRLSTLFERASSPRSMNSSSCVWRPRRWQTAYTYSGYGSGSRRAGDISRFYETSAPLSSSTKPQAREFLTGVINIVQLGVQKAGGTLDLPPSRH